MAEAELAGRREALNSGQLGFRNMLCTRSGCRTIRSPGDRVCTHPLCLLWPWCGNASADDDDVGPGDGQLTMSAFIGGARPIAEQDDGRVHCLWRCPPRKDLSVERCLIRIRG